MRNDNGVRQEMRQYVMWAQTQWSVVYVCVCVCVFTHVRATLEIPFSHLIQNRLNGYLHVQLVYSMYMYVHLPVIVSIILLNVGKFLPWYSYFETEIYHTNSKFTLFLPMSPFFSVHPSCALYLSSCYRSLLPVIVST